MRKLISTILAFVFTLCIITPVCGITLAEIDPVLELSSEEKVYPHISIDDSFTGDGVFVVLSNKASLNFKQFLSNDFSEIGCVEVTDYSSASGAKVQAQVEALSKAKISTQGLSAVDTAKIQSFNQVLYLKLAEPGKKNVLDAIDKLMLREDVIYAGPNYIYMLERAASLPALPHNTESYNRIQLFEAQEISAGSSNVLVGVMDSGIDATNPDLVGRVNIRLSRCFTNSGVIVGGCIDDRGHGTFVAGIIAGQWNGTNIQGGVAPNVTLVSLDVMDGSTTCSTNVIAAIRYAEENNIQILNFSAGISLDDSTDVSLIEAIHDFSGLVVCAAGNGYKNLDRSPSYPASYNTSSDNMIVVGASNGVDGIWIDSESASTTGFISGSNYGTVVDIFAPGESIQSTASSQYTIHNGTYYIDSGTSFAAPFVTGVAALMLSECPNLSPQQIIYGIISNADAIPAHNDWDYFDYPVVLRLNAYKSVLNIPHPWGYIFQDITFHRKACACGETVIEYHTWVSMGAKYRCQYCGYIAVNPPVILGGLDQEIQN